MTTHMTAMIACLVFGLAIPAMSSAVSSEPPIAALEKQFRDLPIEARRLIGPLFWLHGDESKERLETYLKKVAESGNGCFTAESRPHADWLGPGWYRDLDICLQAAKAHHLKLWIFDERWWPSQGVGGKVPARYAAKRLVAEAVEKEGPAEFQVEGHSGERFIASLAGKMNAEGMVEGDSIVDLKPFITGGTLSWQVPAGKWKIMRFTHTQAPEISLGGLSVDGASRESVDWFIKTVYQPHYDRFKADFGQTIAGFFYDEPETRGDWGTELNATLEKWNVDWKKAYVAYKYSLSGEEDVAARYQYTDAFAETWGRVMYGGLSEWCRKRNVKSIGHFHESCAQYFSRDLCAGDIMRLQKYSDMGGVDLVYRELLPGGRPQFSCQIAKLAGSIAHVYDKADDVAMCEAFGAYGQDITYPQMKWATDHLQIRGVNFVIPHSFNPRAPYDGDCPPYFYNGGFEPRYPIYRVYADYSSRLSLMLTGGRHVCPIALLFSGISKQVGAMVTPEDMTSAIQDALYDCDWMPFEVFESKAELVGKHVALNRERYQILTVPAVEVIPYATLAKAREFFDMGGIVIGYGFLPAKSATIGKTSADIAALRGAIWGEDPKQGIAACRKNGNGGKSYLLPEKPSAAELAQVMASDAGVPPALQVVEGDTGNWLNVLHRKKSGCDVFLVCNMNTNEPSRRFRFHSAVNGTPEAWDAMRNEINSVSHKRNNNGVEFDLTLESSESVLIVFRSEKRDLPRRIESSAIPLRDIAVVRDTTTAEVPPADDDEINLQGCRWMWHEGGAATSAPPGTRYFRSHMTIPEDCKIKSARFNLTGDNRFTLMINGQEAGKSGGGDWGWTTPESVDMTRMLHPGENQFAIVAVNDGDKPSPAGLIGAYLVVLESGALISGRIDGSWKAHHAEQAGWDKAGFDDKSWTQAKEAAAFGDPPWGGFGKRGRHFVMSPVENDTFNGRCDVPPSVDLAKSRVFLVMDGLAPEAAAHIAVNGNYAGGFIGRPFRLDVTKHLKTGSNSLRIAPFAPKAANLVVYANQAM